MDDFKFGDDSPKVNPWRQDLLGYAKFSKNLWKSILSLHAPSGYVIGLDGRWGSGKSTVLNFVAAYLRKYNEEISDVHRKITLIEFKPWVVSGHQDLVAAYFKVLSEALAEDLRSEGVGVGLALSANDAVSSVVVSLAKMSIAFDPTGGIATGVAESALSGLLKRRIDAFTEAPSLQSLHDDINEKLAKSGRRFLVIIDDLDRLEDGELKVIMKMVKSVGRLPNVTYLLSYDEQAVSRVMDDIRGGNGKFSEKIVQHQLSLPNPTRGALMTMLERELDFLLPGIDVSERWSTMLAHVSRDWISSPRAVVRFGNALKFCWSELKGEIDPADLIAMEGLRLFSPDVYKWIEVNRDALLGDGRFSLLPDKARERAIAVLTEECGQQCVEKYGALLAVLFPQMAKSLGHSAGNWNSGRARINRGVGSASGYDAYFCMRVSLDHIPKVVVDRVVSSDATSLDIREAIVGCLGKVNSSNDQMVVMLFDEMYDRYNFDSGLIPGDNLVDVLLEVGPDVMDLEGGSVFKMSPHASLSQLVSTVIRRIGGDASVCHIEKAIRTSSRIVFIADLLVDRAREQGRISPVKRASPALPEDCLMDLVEKLCGRIEQMCRSGELLNESKFYDILRIWSLGRPDAKASKWISKNLRSASFFAKIASGLLAYTYDGGVKVYAMKQAPAINFYSHAELLEFGRLHESDDSLTNDERLMVKAVVAGLTNHLAGSGFDGS